MKRAFAILILSLFCFQNIAWASTDYYVAQAVIGSGNGTSAANADAITGSYFTTSGNWVAGLTWHLVGAISNTGQSLIGSGSVGSPIKIKWEPGAYCYSKASGGFFVGSGLHDIEFDGGGTNNGSIFCVSNGANLPFTNNTSGIFLTSCTNINIHDLSITNLCMSVNGDGVTFTGTAVDCAGSCVNITQSNMLVHDCGTGFEYGYNGVGSNWAMVNCEVYNCNWGMSIGAASSGNYVDGVLVSNCYFHDWINWTAVGNPNHHNAGIIYADGSAILTNVTLACNRVGGGFGGSSSTSGFYINEQVFILNIFNNVFDASDGTSTGNAYLTLGMIGYNGQRPRVQVFNNTFINPAKTGDGIYYDAAADEGYGGSRPMYHGYNNIFYGCNYTESINFIGDSPASNSVTLDHSLFYGVTATPFNFGSGISHNDPQTLAQWQANTWEVNCAQGDPKLTAAPGYKPQVGSAAIGVGMDESAVFTYDYYGLTRTNWDIGAVAYFAPVSSGPNIIKGGGSVVISGGGSSVIHN